MNKYLKDILHVCELAFAIWGSFLFILWGNRAIEEFSLGWGYSILLVLATIGFISIILREVIK